MAGKFINTQYKDTVDSIVQMNNDLLSNPFYLFNDKKGTKVTYYNINTEKSTLDKGSKLAYTDIGEDSPIRFNVIHDLFLYQFNKVELNLENGEFGLESNPIEGDSYILPNTINPTDGDFFEVDHVNDSTWLFKVKDAQRDTLENGNNVYKISWVLDRTTNKDILKNVVEEYQWVNVQTGTNVKSVVRLEKYETAEKLDQLGSTLRSYFKDLFYSDKIQSFTYKWYTEYNMYDPFSIEFIIRNKLLEDGSDNYLYVKHQYPVPTTFSIDYSKSIFSAFDYKDKDNLTKYHYKSQADLITSTISIFNTRFEQYFALNYRVVDEVNGPFNPRDIIPIIDEDFINRIINNSKYEEDNMKYNNLIIKYFNNEDVYADDINCIDNIDLEPAKDIYYKVLLLIFCVDFYTKKLLS